VGVTPMEIRSGFHQILPFLRNLKVVLTIQQAVSIEKFYACR
jgi:hypothetical protein